MGRRQVILSSALIGWRVRETKYFLLFLWKMEMANVFPGNLNLLIDSD
jgi:hypothetical protein